MITGSAARRVWVLWALVMALLGATVALKERHLVADYSSGGRWDPAKCAQRVAAIG